jgi:hypothetical protein
MSSLIKRADQVSAFHEATQLAGFEPKEARRYFGTPTGARTPRLVPLSPPEAQALFLERFAKLAG